MCVRPSCASAYTVFKTKHPTTVQGGGDPWDAVSLCYFLQKSPTISGSFTERDLQLKAPYASSPLCNVAVNRNSMNKDNLFLFPKKMYMYTYIYIYIYILKTKHSTM